LIPTPTKLKPQIILKLFRKVLTGNFILVKGEKIMIRKSNVFSMMVIGVMMLALLKMPSNTVSAAGKPQTKTPTPAGPTPTPSVPTATRGLASLADGGRAGRKFSIHPISPS
jgi:hypothetical protein